jgi:nucleotide-binding universal stress UspA family protein
MDCCPGIRRNNRDNAVKILICSDGSKQAEHALRLGTTIAAGCRADVALLGIMEAAGQSDTVLDSLKRAQNLLADKKINAELTTKPGNTIEEIVRHTEEHAYDLIVIGAARKEAHGGFWMSSKSFKLIKELKPPVLSVAGDLSKIQRILICSGGKRYIDNAVRLAGEIAKGLGASITLLHVMPVTPALFATLPGIEQDTEVLLRSESELSINLRTGRETLQQLGVAADIRLRHGSVLEQILHEIHEGNYDLIVTGSALSRSLRTYVLGDITREIVNRTNCAVLVVRSQQQSMQPRFGLRGWLGKLSPP